MEKDILAKLINLAGNVGGDVIFTSFKSRAEGLMTTQTMECTGEEMEKLIHLAEKNNIKVRFSPFKTDKDEIKYRKDASLVIGIRAGMVYDQYVFNLAHELAHWFMHFDKGNTITSDRHAEYEEQADRAANMLLAALQIK